MKDTLIFQPNDRSACGWYRMRFPANLLQTKLADISLKSFCTPFEVKDDSILCRTIAIYVQRPVHEQTVTVLQHYNRLKRRYGFKVFIDFDDILFNVDGVDVMPDYKKIDLELDKMEGFIRKSLNYVDGVVVTNDVLQALFSKTFNYENVFVVPNSVPSYCFGRTMRPLEKTDIKKPVVLYAGSTKFHWGDNDMGDFAGPWAKWIIEASKNGEIEYHMFGDSVPKFLEGADVHLENGCSTLEFPATIASIQPDIYIAPLAPDIFNCCKSDLKLKEAAAIGAAFVGSSFEYGPYEGAHKLSKVPVGASVDDLRAIVKNICNRKNFNDVVQWQYGAMEHYGWNTESRIYMDRLLKVLCGDSVKHG